MRWLFKIKPQFFLRLGLALTYVYSGIGLVKNPGDWQEILDYWPAFFLDQVGRIGAENLVVGQGIAELVLAAVFLVWFVPRGLVTLAALLVILEVVWFFWFGGLAFVTFRGFSVLATALTLFWINFRRGWVEYR